MDFTYHKKLGPIVGALLALACIETIVLHIIAMALWGWKVAIVIGLLDLSVMAMLYGMIRSFRLNPITMHDDAIIMRRGRRVTVSIDRGGIASFRPTWSGDDLKARHVLNMASAAWPTVMFDLKEPIMRRGKRITAIAHCVDEPDRFQRAVRQWSDTRGARQPVA